MGPDKSEGRLFTDLGAIGVVKAVAEATVEAVEEEDGWGVELTVGIGGVLGVLTDVEVVEAVEVVEVGEVEGGTEAVVVGVLVF